MNVKSFGCSFIFGNDLHDDGRDGPWATPSKHTWPALIAKQLGAGYGCHARGGMGNLYILSRLLHHINEVGDNRILPGPLVIVGWTWMDRYDYRPDDLAQAQDPWRSLMPIDTTPEANFYYKHLHSEPRDKLTSLMAIHTAINILKSRNIPFIMTCMDEYVFDRQWHNTSEITLLQDCVEPYITRFEGKNFLDWSREKGFPISETLHPLEPAHAAAAELMLPLAQSLL